MPWPKGRPRSPETRTKISAGLTGITRSPETRAKMSVAKIGSTGPLGHIRSAEHRAKLSLANSKGDDVGSSGMHKRMDKILPRECALADDSCVDFLDVSFRWDTAPGELVRTHERSGPWSLRPEDYWRLCRSHHRRFDKGGLDGT